MEILPLVYLYSWVNRKVKMRGRRGRRSGRGRHLFEFVRAFITDRKSFSSWMILEGGDMIRNVTFVEWRERSLRFRHRFHFELPRSYSQLQSCTDVSRPLDPFKFHLWPQGRSLSLCLSPPLFWKICHRGNFPMTPRSCYADPPLILPSLSLFVLKSCSLWGAHSTSSFLWAKD